ncbi:MAG: 3-phosphoshikimate 1-carboxyvinyltransferase [Verrucomicrobiae bacterium]|nr:3-phosphoshikimate 1-carboxyvinyltransferase [Verrucomicrobiae bacterium]
MSTSSSSAPSQYKVRAASPFTAELVVPGDKSISHRSVMFASLSNGICDIDGFLPSADCWCTVEAMRAMGVQIDVLEEGEFGPTKLRVHGNSGRFEAASGPVNCGNSGTTMRLLSGILAAQPFETELYGDESLSRRPMDRIAGPLSQMGAVIEGRGDRCMPPIRITGTKDIQPIHYDSPVASAQVKSAILLAGMFANGKTSVSEPYLSRDHTERMLKYLLVKTVREGNTVSIWGGQTPESRDLKVPGDLSSAAFWIVAAAARPKSQLRVREVGLNPTRSGILKALIRMGARLKEIVDDENGEPVGSVEVNGGELHGIEIGGDEIPKLIDEIPILAVAGALAKGTTIIRDAHELRVKESDRISAVAENLRRMGVTVQEFADGMEITGGAKLKGATVESLGDHRIAMAFAVAGLYAEGETIVKDVDCVSTSYPGFEQELKQLIG